MFLNIILTKLCVRDKMDTGPQVGYVFNLFVSFIWFVKLVDQEIEWGELTY